MSGHSRAFVGPRHVVITGATSGLGRALAESYAAPGRTLSLVGRRPEALAAVAQACRSRGAEVHSALLDVTASELLCEWLLAQDDGRSVDLLIANAGIGGAAVVPPPSGEDGALARQILSVNTLGVVNAVTPLLPRMAARRHGHIALIGSISAAVGLPQSPVYCASKAAIRVYGDALRRLLRSQGVKVTNVLPGFIDTPMSQSLDMPRPWCWPAAKAAARVIRDIERGAPQCIFPWQLRLLTNLQAFVPLSVVDAVLTATMKTGWSNAKAAPPGSEGRPYAGSNSGESAAASSRTVVNSAPRRRSE